MVGNSSSSSPLSFSLSSSIIYPTATHLIPSSSPATLQVSLLAKSLKKKARLFFSAIFVRPLQRQLSAPAYIPCMDAGSAATAAGIDPKILDNWQTDGAFSVASWEHLGYDQPPEWDTSQESSQCADVADLGAFHDPLTNSLLDRSRDIQNRYTRSLSPLSPSSPLAGRTTWKKN